MATVNLSTLVNPTGGGVTDHGALTGLADDDHTQYHTDARGNALYAPIAKGVTNGDTHDHNGGDGAQVDHGGLGGLADDDHTQYHTDARGDARYALLAKGVTNGDTHDHNGGDGAQIAHTSLSSIGTNTHAQIDTHLSATAPHSGHELTANRNAASGYAGLDGSSKLTGTQQVYGSAANTACVGNDSRLADARTPTSHVIATNTALGGQHTISGASAGHVLRASAATAANFQQLDHTDLSTVGTNTHAQIDTHLANTSNPHSTTAAQVGALSTSAFSGVAKITVGTSAPGSPSAGDIWVDTN